MTEATGTPTALFARLTFTAAVFATLAVGCAQRTQTSSNIEAFEERVDAYMQVRNKAAEGLKEGSTATPGKTTTSADVLADRIRAARQNAQAGAVFGPIGADLQRIIRAEVRGSGGANVLGSINDSNPSGVELGVNQRYPAELPRTTVPGSVLSKLPQLPPELEYGFLGTSLLLIDVRANLVVDTLRDVLPGPGNVPD